MRFCKLEVLLPFVDEVPQRPITELRSHCLNSSSLCVWLQPYWASWRNTQRASCGSLHWLLSHLFIPPTQHGAGVAQLS